MVRKTLQGIWSEAVKEFGPVYADMVKIATGAGRPELSVLTERASDKPNDPTSLPKPQRIIGGALSSCLFWTTFEFSQSSAPGSLPSRKRLWEYCVTSSRKSEWMPNGCALTCFRPMKSICQRQNTSMRSFGFGRPSGAASRLHEMKAPSTVEDTLAEECFRTRAFISECFASPEAASGHPRNNRVRGAC